MNIHNVMEDMVVAEVNKICESIGKDGVDTDDICTCEQCRQDAACLVLNKIHPFYIISNRGLVRASAQSIQNRQKSTDIYVMAYDALKTVKLHQRANHNMQVHTERKGEKAHYNIPAIVGRLFNGTNFEPMVNIDVELYSDGKPVSMLDSNWQNPCRLASKTEGVYTFWPEPVGAAAADEIQTFKYSIKAEAEGFEPLYHFFELPVKSETGNAEAAGLDRTFKLVDLYMFPPGGDEEDF
jgi:competence protein ComFB